MKSCHGCEGPLCSLCGGCIAEGECACRTQRPNRIVIETTDPNAITAIRAERPDEVMIIVRSPAGDMVRPADDLPVVSGEWVRSRRPLEYQPDDTRTAMVRS